MEQNQNLDDATDETQVEEKDVKNESDVTSDGDTQQEDGEVAEEEDEIESLRKEVDAAKDKYLRLFSEFENFRRRTAKERLDLIQTSTEALMVELLPILDDFVRARESITPESEMKSVAEGVNLIESKLKRVLEQKGLKPMEVKQGDDFDSDLHEAVSQIPAPKKKLVGKVVETIEDGYFLGEKVIRYAKVVIGGE